MDLDYGTIFLYCLYACIQMYLLMATGFFAFKRKMFSSKSIAMVSEILFVFLIPFYGLVEITRIGTLEILNSLSLNNLAVFFNGASYSVTIFCKDGDNSSISTVLYILISLRTPVTSDLSFLFPKSETSPQRKEKIRHKSYQ